LQELQIQWHSISIAVDLMVPNICAKIDVFEVTALSNVLYENKECALIPLTKKKIRSGINIHILDDSTKAMTSITAQTSSTSTSNTLNILSTNNIFQ
jgi:hypothetical protein